MRIGPYTLPNNVIAAPMAGVSDKPYRKVCIANGAGLAVSEMVTSQSKLHHTTKTRFRLDHSGEPEPRVVQIVGTEPELLAQAAQFNVTAGAHIIDINMGCPAKKVCQKAAGSALLSNEPLVKSILQQVVSAVDVPVTVKIRTGADPAHRNGVTIAQIAQDAGVAAITVHGRTRACRFVGAVEYDTIAAIKQTVEIPVIANGDIDSSESAQQVLSQTKADAIMIGRAAQGRPWLFAQIAEYLSTGHLLDSPTQTERASILLAHLKDIHAFYGERLGVKFARKHIKWYAAHWDGSINPNAMSLALRTENAQQQLIHLFDALPDLNHGAARHFLAA